MQATWRSLVPQVPVKKRSCRLPACQTGGSSPHTPPRTAIHCFVFTRAESNTDMKPFSNRFQQGKWKWKAAANAVKGVGQHLLVFPKIDHLKSLFIMMAVRSIVTNTLNVWGFKAKADLRFSHAPRPQDYPENITSKRWFYYIHLVIWQFL